MSLKILHTGDWHLGQTFFEYDRQKEHAAFLRFLESVLVDKEIDVLLICGDVFDTANPSAESQRLFFRFLRNAVTAKPDVQIIVISGNHDSPGRLEAPNPLFEEFNIHVVGMLPRTEDRKIDYARILIPLSNKNGEKAWCLAIPFLRPGDYPGSDVSNFYTEGISKIYREAFDYADKMRKPGEAVIVLGHLHALHAQLSEDDRCERLIAGGLEAVSASIFDEKIAYMALGHIHKAQKVARRNNIRYAGSPLPMSFSETGYQHQFVYVEIVGEETVHIESIGIPTSVSLLRIPDKPKVLDEVMIELEQLPDKQEHSDAQAPYLEVNVLLDAPMPSLKNQIEIILNNKYVRLAKITTSYGYSGDRDREKMSDPEDLQKMQPLDMLKRIYFSKYGAELPQELADTFREALLMTNGGSNL